MNDKDIIKALEDSIHKMKECCVTNWDFYASGDFVKNILDLINRQKAEIERLQKEGLQLNKTFMDFVNVEKYEAIKEFAERLKEEATVDDDSTWWVANIDIDNLVKEMTEGKE